VLLMPQKMAGALSEGQHHASSGQGVATPLQNEQTLFCTTLIMCTFGKCMSFGNSLNCRANSEYHNSEQITPALTDFLNSELRL